MGADNALSFRRLQIRLYGSALARAQVKSKGLKEVLSHNIILAERLWPVARNRCQMLAVELPARPGPQGHRAQGG
jgi:hypothetical protein